MTVPEAAALLAISATGARGIFDRLVTAGIVRVVPNTWPALYVAQDLIDLIDAPHATFS